MITAAKCERDFRKMFLRGETLHLCPSSGPFPPGSAQAPWPRDWPHLDNLVRALAFWRNLHIETISQEKE